MMKMKHIIEIKFVEDEFVEITLGDSLFRLDLDERGSPKFPESLKEKVPLYMPEMIGQRIKNKRQNPNQGPIYVAVNHEPCCPQMRGPGRCNCNPDLLDIELREYSGISEKKLTCKMCKESSIGEIRFDVVRDASGSWKRFWIEGGDMFYWLVAIGEFDFRLLLCHFCMIDRRIEFPNAIEWARIRGMTTSEVRNIDCKMEEKEETTHDPESFKGLTEAQNRSYPNQLSANKQLKDEVRIKDELVEIKRRDGESMFIFAIDERGLPYFPERMKGKLPSYVTEHAQKTIHHKLWCAEIEGLGMMCDCTDPTAETSEYRKIACQWSECVFSHPGWQNTIGKAYRGIWTNDSRRLYWLVGPDPTGTIICGDCLKDIVDFSDVV
jgi:hypothetical protein